MRKYDRTSVHLQREPHDFTRMHGRRVNGTDEQFFIGQNFVVLIEKQDREDFAVTAAKDCLQVYENIESGFYRWPAAKSFLSALTRGGDQLVLWY